MSTRTLSSRSIGRVGRDDTIPGITIKPEPSNQQQRNLNGPNISGSAQNVASQGPSLFARSGARMLISSITRTIL